MNKRYISTSCFPQIGLITKTLLFKADSELIEVPDFYMFTFVARKCQLFFILERIWFCAVHRPHCLCMYCCVCTVVHIRKLVLHAHCLLRHCWRFYCFRTELWVFGSDTYTAINRNEIHIFCFAGTRRTASSRMLAQGTVRVMPIPPRVGPEQLLGAVLQQWAVCLPSSAVPCESSALPASMPCSP